jgi:poly(A) polymerase
MPGEDVLLAAKRVALLLRSAGYEAWLVGGCVRDLLLGRTPKDCDVSTSAKPDEVLAIFPRAMLVGLHFGVVIVQDGREQIEVATYRSDGHYSDGRRPDQVTFETDVRNDLQRRDFTINALLMDPKTEAVIDYVGGRADLEAGLIRAIGEPGLRFREDHLRLMRAVRFAARFGFRIEPRTWEAICAQKEGISRIAVERVKGELARILAEGNAAVGMALLQDCGLLGLILPEAGALEILGRLRSPGFALALASILPQSQAEAVADRLRLSNEERALLVALVSNQWKFAQVLRMSSSSLKRFLRMKDFDQHLELYRAAVSGDQRYETVSRLRESMTGDDLWPARLLTGDDLKQMGVPAGPLFAKIMSALEDAQLEGHISRREEAEALVRAAFSDVSST